MKKLLLLLLAFVAQSITANVTEAEKQAYKNAILQCFKNHWTLTLKIQDNTVTQEVTDQSVNQMFRICDACIDRINTKLSTNDCTILVAEAVIEHRAHLKEQYQKVQKALQEVQKQANNNEVSEYFEK